MDTGGEVKRTFQLPALDPAVEIICRAWRSNTPSTTGPDTAREARNRRIKKVRLDTLCKTRRANVCVCEWPPGLLSKFMCRKLLS